MKKFNLKKKDVKNVIIASVLLVVGALFCCSLAMTNKVLSYVIGTSIIVAGALIIANVAVSKKELLNTEGLVGAVIIAFGILFAGNQMTWLIFNYIPFLLMCVGGIIIADAIIKFVRENETGRFILILILGVVTFALGICLRFVKGFSDFTALILGIVMIVYAIYMFASVFVGKEKEKEKKDK